MVSRFELAILSLCIILIAGALYTVRFSTTETTSNQAASISALNQNALSVIDTTSSTIRENIDLEITQPTMKIDDIKIGTGRIAETGDTVSVHYIGTLQDGTEFDNSHKRGAPIEFTLGAGQVIAGWEEGIAGMSIGGERTLVIPPDKAYGEQGVGPIPPNSTLVFTVELVAIK